MLGVSYGLGWFLGFIVIFGVLTLVSALTLVFAANENLQSDTKLRDGIKASATALAVATAISAVLFGAIHLSGLELSARGVLVLVGIFFLSNVLSIMGYLRKVDGRKIGFLRASWISVLQTFAALMLYGFLSWLIKLMTE